MSDANTGIIDTIESRMRIGGMEDLPSNVRLDGLRFGRIGYDPIRYTRATKVLEQQVTKALERSHSTVLRYAPDRDPEALTVFQDYFKNFPEGRDDLKTWFEVLELDDYVSYGGKA